MPDMTAGEIVVEAYRNRGTLNPKAALLAAGLLTLQNMMALWSIEGLIVPYYATENFTLTPGQAVYTIGTGGDLNTARPSELINGFIRTNDDDYPVNVKMTQDQYNGIVSKDMEARPKRAYYDPQYPLGKLKFDYEADEAYDFHLVSEKPLTELAVLGTSISLPKEINEPLINNLTIRLHAGKIDIKSQVFVLAREGKEILERYNAGDKLGAPILLDNAIRGYGARLDIMAGE